jgi:hypothetical protein
MLHIIILTISSGKSIGEIEFIILVFSFLLVDQRLDQTKKLWGCGIKVLRGRIERNKVLHCKLQYSHYVSKILFAFSISNF